MIKDKQLLKDIAQFAKKLHAQDNMTDAMGFISQKAKEFLWVDRCSVFIHNKKHDLLWTSHGDGLNCLVLQTYQGVVGKTFWRKKAQVVNDIKNESSFFGKVDKNTGYITKNMATVPIFDLEGKVIGVFQVINKVDGAFTQEDMAVLEFLARYLGLYFETAIALDEQQVVEKFLKENKDFYVDHTKPQE